MSSQKNRVQHAEALLAGCTNPTQNLDGWMPAWSSHQVKKIVEEVLQAPNAEIHDLFQGLWNLLAHTQAALTGPMTEFLRSITVTALVRFRLAGIKEWDEIDFRWLLSDLGNNTTAAQAFFALNVLTETSLATYKKEILAALNGNEFLHRALHTPGLGSPDTLPYGHYRITPIEINSEIADGVFYDYWIGAVLGSVISETQNGRDQKRVKPFTNGVRPPLDWQNLIQEFLGD